MRRACWRNAETCAARTASDEMIVRVVGPERQCKVTDIGNTIDVRVSASITMKIVGVAEVDVADARDSAGERPITGLIVGKCGWPIYILIVVGKIAGGRLARDKSYHAAI